MGITFGNIGLAEPSTITKTVASVVIARGSTNEHQEILVIGDPQSSLGAARVMAVAPTSTEFGLVVRIASGPSSAADMPVSISGNSTVIQGTSPWVVGFQAGNISSVVQTGNSSGLTVRPVWSSSGVDQPVRALLSSTSADNPVNASITSITASAGRINIGSTAADNAVLVSGNSTVFQGGSPWVIGGNSSVRANLSSTAADNPVTAQPSSTGWASSAGFHFDGSGNLLMSGGAGGSSQVTVSQFLDSSGGSVIPIDSANVALRVNVVASSSGRINIGSTAADNAVSISGNSTVFQGGSPWTVTFAAGLISTSALTGNSSGLNVRPIWSSSGVDQPVRANLSSTAADNPVVATIGTNLQSTAAPSSASSGLVVRQVVDNILTTASTNAFSPSTSFTIQSSGAALRSYVTAYSILSTNAGPHKIKFYSSGTMTWPVMFAAVSSAVSGANLAVSAPAYLFRTAASEALTLQLGSGASTIGGYQVAVSYFRAP